MNYGTYTSYTIKSWVFEHFRFFEIFHTNKIIWTYFGIWGVFVKEVAILNIGFGFVVLNSIWWHGFKILFRHFSYGTFGGMFLGFVVPKSKSHKQCPPPKKKRKYLCYFPPNICSIRCDVFKHCVLYHRGLLKTFYDH